MFNCKFRKAKRDNVSTLCKLFSCFSLASTILLTPVYAQQIIIDGQTNTSLKVNNNITNISTTTIKNSNAFNSFKRFNVNKGNVVNLVVPANSKNLINLVHSEKTQIDGILNSIKNNKIGGNIFFVNPYGITVGTEGVINVGSLTAVTPTVGFMNKFFISPGNPSEASVQALINGTAPVNNGASIINNGEIRAIEAVKLDAGSVVNNGSIVVNSFSNDNQDTLELEISDIVNTEDVKDASQLIASNGGIIIQATNDIIHSGSIITDGNNNLNAGNISLVANHNIELKAKSVLNAKGIGENSSGGNILVFADNNTNFEKGALIDAGGGKVSGDGGFVEVSAVNNVDINGELKAKSYNGKPGEILIDPFNLTINNKQYSDGANLRFQATNNLIVSDNVVISSRNIAYVFGGDHSSDLSQGDSGDIEFDANRVTFNPGSKVYSFANNGYDSGDIRIIANELNIDTTDTNTTLNSGSGNVIISRKFLGDINVNGYYDRSIFGFIFGSLDLSTSELNQIVTDNLILGNHASTTSRTYNVNLIGDVTLDSSLSLNGYGTYIDADNLSSKNITLTSAKESLLAGNIVSHGNITLVSEDKSTITTTKSNKTTNILADGNLILQATDKKGEATIEPGSKKHDVININAGNNVSLYGYSEASVSGKNTKIEAQNISIESNKKDTGVLNQASLFAIDSINISSTKGKVKVDGDLQAGVPRNKVLLVNADGTIDPSSNIDATITGSTIIVDEPVDVGANGGSINLDGKKVLGSGSLTVYGGMGSADITNNSSYDLQIDSLGLSDASNGSIIINNKSVTTDYKKIEVFVNNSTTTGDININNNTASNVLLAGNIKSEDTDINITNLQGNILNAGDHLLSANNINLIAENGSIGSAIGSIDIDITNGLIYASALNDINLIENEGDMNINLIKSLAGTAYLATSNGSIVDVNNDGVDIVANNAVINSTNVLGDLNLDITDSTEINTIADAYISGKTGNLTADTGGNFSYKNIDANNVSIISDQNVTLSNGNILGNTDIINVNPLQAGLTDVSIGTAPSDLYIAGNVNIDSTGTANVQADIDGTIYVNANNAYITEINDVKIDQINSLNNAVVNSLNGMILDYNADETANITAKNISLNSNGIGTSLNDLNIDTVNNGNISAYSSNSDIFITENNGDLNINSIVAENADIYLVADKSIVDADSLSSEAKIAGNSINLMAGTDGSIGSNDPEGAIEIQTAATGFLTANAIDGNIYLKEVGYQPTINVKEVKAKNEIHLEADWKIQNFEGATISTIAENSIIKLTTDDTKLFDDFTNTGGSISTGTNGIVTIARNTAGDIYASYEGADNLIHPIPGETTYVTTRELGTINSGCIELDASNGEEIWDNAPSLNIIIDDDYDFLTHPVDVADGTIYILRESDGILTLGGLVDGIGVITQEEIDNITANDIFLGNVLDPTEYVFGDTTQINLLDPDFSQTSSTNSPSNVTLATSGSIIDADVSSEIGLKAKNLTLIADSNNDGTGGIGSTGSGEFVDISLLENGTLNAKSSESIYILERNASIYLDKVESTSGAVVLHNYQDIIDNNNDTNVNIIAGDYIYLQAGTYYDYDKSIGSPDNFVEIDSAVSGTGYFSATATNIYVEEKFGDLNVGQIAGRVYPNKPTVHKAAENIYLKANDSDANILDYDVINDYVFDQYNIHAINLTLEAKNGSIGTGSIGQFEDLDLYGANLTNLRAEAGTGNPDSTETINIYLYGSEAGGENLSVKGTVDGGAAIKTNNNSTVNLYTNRHLLGGNNDSIADIEAKTINLRAGCKIGESEVNYPDIITIDLLGDEGTLSAYVPSNASEKVNIKSIGDMRIKQIEGKYINLTSIDGSIINSFADSGINIDKDSYTEGGSVRLTSINGSIGEINKPIQLRMENTYIITDSTGDTYLNNIDTGGAISIMQSYSGGDYELSSVNTVILRRDGGTPPPVMAPNGTVNIQTSGDIIDYNTGNYTLILADNINLEAAGNIGYSSTYGYRYVDLSATNKIDLSAGKGVFAKMYGTSNLNSLDAGSNVILYSNGDLNLGVIDATGYNVTINSTGSILNNTMFAFNIIGKDIILNSDIVVGSVTDEVKILYSGLEPVINAPETYVYSEQN